MPAVEIQIRQVLAADVLQLAQLSTTTFCDAFAHQNTAADMDLYLNATFNSQSLLNEINHPENHFYFALIDNEVAGYIKISYPETSTSDKAFEIERLYVLAAYQGKSIGEQLINFAIAKAGDLNFTSVILGVWEHNLHAIRFYKRMGFTKFSEHDFILGTDRQTDWLMKRIL